jgi:hypothetical protein
MIVAIILLVICGVGSFLTAFFLVRKRDVDSSRDSSAKCTAYKGDGKSCRVWSDGACHYGTIKEGSCEKNAERLSLSLYIVSVACLVMLVGLGARGLWKHYRQRKSDTSTTIWSELSTF